jgi:predicted MFS family arabinose efflux permease
MPASHPPKPPSARLIWLLTVAAAVSVANLYYNQPLLSDIAVTFGASASGVGTVAMLTQAGYAVGLLLFVPLGDIVERRRLMAGLLCAVALSLGAAAVSPSLAVLAAFSFAIGVTTVVPQLIIPYAAGLTPPAMRGRVVGVVVSGLLIGILGGRVVAGLLAHVVGWRGVFGIASGAMLLLALALRWLLPIAPAASERMGYGVLLRSLVTLFRAEPVIRDAALLGALTFASFSAFWTTLTFRLHAAPLDYGSGVAGAFGLLGVIGAAAAPLAGRMADRLHPRAIIGVALLVNVAAWLVLLFAGHTLAGIAVGVLLLDAGTQAAQVSNQARVYTLPVHAHGRLNTIYMVCYFVGGATGSAAATAAWGAFGWNGVCAVALGALGLALTVYALGHQPPPPTRTFVGSSAPVR